MTKNGKRTLMAAPVIALALIAAPEPAAAGDCGADYAGCIGRLGTGSSDALHETECVSEYWRCVSRRLLFF